MSKIYDIFLRSKNVYLELVKTENIYIHRESNDRERIHRDQFKYIIETIENKFFYLLPEIKVNKIRRKRGLINGLGSIVKAITGNLDEEDAIKFEKEIYTLKKYVKQSQTKQNQNIGLMNSFMKEYDNTLKKIKNNQDIIIDNLNRINRNISVLDSRINILQIYMQIENNLQQIYDKLTLLETAITFASLKKLHPSILEPRQLLNELLNIRKENNIRLPFETNRANIHLIESTIEVKAYSTSSSLTFILEIPIVSRSNYDLLHIYPIPDDNNLIRIPKSPYLILGSKEFSYLQEPCNEITDSIKICNHLKLERVEETQDCVIQILRHISANNCSTASVILPRTKIEQIKENSWIIITQEEETLRTKCINNEKFQRIKGSYRITTIGDCYLEIDGKILQTHIKELNVKETIPLPRFKINLTKSEYAPIQLEHINLDELHTLSRLHIDPENKGKQYLPHRKPSWTSIVTLIIIISYIIFLINRRYNIIKCKRTNTMTKASNQPEESLVPQQPPQPAERQPILQQSQQQLQQLPVNQHHPARFTLGVEELRKLG